MPQTQRGGAEQCRCDGERGQRAVGSHAVSGELYRKAQLGQWRKKGGTASALLRGEGTSLAGRRNVAREQQEHTIEVLKVPLGPKEKDSAPHCFALWGF